MQYLSLALPLAALVSGAFANPFKGNPHCTSDSCLAVVTGKAALGDEGLRKFHCSSFLATTVTPPAVTVTSTITADGKPGVWPRASVTVCPNEVPNYASACNEAGYSSACACFGFTEVKTFTLAPTTTTKTVFVKPTAGTCSVVTKTLAGSTTTVAGSTTTVTDTITSTSTKTVGGHGSASVITVTTTDTVTSTSTSIKFIGGSGSTLPAVVTVTETSTLSASVVTVLGSASPYPVTVTETVTVAATTTRASVTTTSPASVCVVDDAKATALVTGFMKLLQFTSYAGNATLGIPAGRGYPFDVSNAILSSKFSDISDSINFMAGFALGSTTFPTKGAFDYGQGVLQPEVAIEALNIWHDCNSITWRWRIFSTFLPVTGINYMIIDPADGKILKNYAEFDSGAWLQSFGRQCAANAIPTPKVPADLKARSENRFAMLE